MGDGIEKKTQVVTLQSVSCIQSSDVLPGNIIKMLIIHSIHGKNNVYSFNQSQGPMNYS